MRNEEPDISANEVVFKIDVNNRCISHAALEVLFWPARHQYLYGVWSKCRQAVEPLKEVIILCQLHFVQSIKHAICPLNGRQPNQQVLPLVDRGVSKFLF